MPTKAEDAVNQHSTHPVMLLGTDPGITRKSHDLRTQRDMLKSLADHRTLLHLAARLISTSIRGRRLSADGNHPLALASGRQLNATDSSTRQFFPSLLKAPKPTIFIYTAMADYFKVKQRLHEALVYKKQHPTASFRFLERQFKVYKDRICRRFNSKNSRSARDSNNLRLNKE